LCAVDNGIDQVHIYRINQETDKLQRVEILRMQRMSGPRVVRFSKDGRYMYVLCELQNEIEVYTYDGSGKLPVFEKIQEISTLSKGGHERDFDAAMALNLSPDEKYLYCTTAGENTVSLYKIDEKTGLLDKRFTLPISGVYPKSVVAFPDGKHIAVANNSSNTVNTFTIDYDKNTLVMKGRPQKVDQPNCILFKEIEV
jgi:6-phosphogluconolactonase